MVLRRRSPELPRPFVTPVVWLIAPATVVGCVYLFSSLQTKTMLFFLGWNAVGVVVYLLYGRIKSRMAVTA
jgi:APA family basic amino acid/polyamine antiporter